jgi:hypothetical protein
MMVILELTAVAVAAQTVALVWLMTAALVALVRNGPELI